MLLFIWENLLLRFNAVAVHFEFKIKQVTLFLKQCYEVNNSINIIHILFFIIHNYIVLEMRNIIMLESIKTGKPFFFFRASRKHNIFL